MSDKVKIDVSRAARSAAKVEAAKQGKPMSSWASEVILLAAGEAETKRNEQEKSEDV